MIVVFLWQRSTKPLAPILCTTQTFGGDVWQEAEAALHVEQTWDLIADAEAVAQAELAQATLRTGLQRSSSTIVITCLGGAITKGHVVQAGEGMYLLQPVSGGITAVNHAAIMRVTGLPSALPVAHVDDGGSGSLTIRRWLRDYVEKPIDCRTIDGWSGRGALMSIGRDFFEIRDSDGVATTVAIAAIATIRT